MRTTHPGSGTTVPNNEAEYAFALFSIRHQKAVAQEEESIYALPALVYDIAQSRSAQRHSLVTAFRLARKFGRADMIEPVDSAVSLQPHPGRLFSVLAWIVGMMMLSACASESRTRQPIPGQESAPWPGSAEYLNEFGDTIPAPLLRAMDNAYAVPEPFDCDTLVSEVQELESVLGEDLDSRAGEPVDENMLASVLISAVKGVVPYRGWLMRLSGETKRLQRGVAAIAAGCVRRAYLKGLGQSQGCPLPATPKRPHG